VHITDHPLTVRNSVYTRIHAYPSGLSWQHNAAVPDFAPPPSLLSAFQLFCHLFGEVVWTRRCRLIFSLDLLLHFLAASTVTALLWAHMVVDRLGRYKWKIYFFW
jgi:hypothetical protein